MIAQERIGHQGSARPLLRKIDAMGAGSKDVCITWDEELTGEFRKQKRKNTSLPPLCKLVTGQSLRPESSSFAQALHVLIPAKP